MPVAVSGSRESTTTDGASGAESAAACAWAATSPRRRTRSGLLHRSAAPALAAAAALALLTGGAHALPIDSLVSFGDSLSDVGSGPADPPDYGGRFSNGPVWQEQLATRLGLSPAQTLHLAIGGATSGQDGLVGPGTGLLAQVDGYTAAPPAPLGASTLYTVWAGGNDLIGAAFSGATGDVETLALQAADNVATAVSQLASVGADRFLVPNLPDAALFPMASMFGDALSPLATLYSETLNARLATELALLESSLGIQVHLLDVASLVDAIVADPAAHGLANASDPCTQLFGEAPDCTTPESYLFWDEVHFTTDGHALVAGEALRTVPEPTLPGLAAAAALAAGVAAARARRAAA